MLRRSPAETPNTPDTLDASGQPHRGRIARCQPLVVAALLFGSLGAPWLAAPASAQGRVITSCGTVRPNDVPPRRSPRALSCPGQVVRLSTSTVVDVTGRVARTNITQVFENRGGRLGEADFVYPLPNGAALEALTLEIDGTMVTGEVLDAKAARATYERIVRAQRDPALVEWAGLGLVRARIFPFGAGERRTVVLQYSQLLPREGDALRVTGQLVGSQDPRDEQATGDFRIRYSGNDLGAPWSPTHEVRVRAGRGDAAPAEATLSGGSGDVVAFLPIRSDGSAPSVTVLTHSAGDLSGTFDSAGSGTAVGSAGGSAGGWTGNDARRGRNIDHHALVIVAPPRDRPAALPRDVTLALDVSGSMSGTKLAQAVAAGQALLRTLRPTDRMQLLAFAEQLEQQSSALVPATRDAVRRASKWLSTLEARGGTNIGAALELGLARTRAGSPRSAVRNATRDAATRLPLMLLITDGQPTVGLPSADILDSASVWQEDTRLFTFGVGEDVDASLVEQLALDGRGAAHFVRPEESVERAVSLLAERLAAPLLANVQVAFSGGQLRQLFAPHGTDLMAGQELVFLARYQGNDTGTVRVTGMSGSRTRTVTADYRFPPTPRADRTAPAGSTTGAGTAQGAGGTTFVPRLWAVQRVAALDAQRRRHGASQELDDEMRALGTRYGVPTPFTSFLVLEPGATVATGPVPRASARRIRTGLSGPPMSAAPMSAAPRGSAAAGSASAPQSNTTAFESARRAARQRKAVNLSASDAMLAEDEMAASSEQSTRLVRGLRFTEVDSVWTDQRLLADTSWSPVLTVRVQPFSGAWTALAQTVPALRDVFALGDRIRVRGRTVLVEITESGVSDLSAAQLAALSARW